MLPQRIEGRIDSAAPGAPRCSPSSWTASWCDGVRGAVFWLTTRQVGTGWRGGAGEGKEEPPAAEVVKPAVPGEGGDGAFAQGDWLPASFSAGRCASS
jgi:hypothetical protein